MTETFTDNGALATWSTPQCPFAIEYSRKALDDIRLAVVDAFFSLPRGGAEIGGILLGKFSEQRLQILDYAPIECEHAFGPAFTLSPADQERLGDMLRQAFPGGLRPVGWYHSHTRSEISLSEGDLDIHNRYFAEPWQVALVLRPSTLQPTQAGFFCREPDGSIHAQSSYREFVVEALPLQQVPSGAPQAAPGPMRETEPHAAVLTLRPEDEPGYSSSAEETRPSQPLLLEPHSPEPGMLAEPAAARASTFEQHPEEMLEPASFTSVQSESPAVSPVAEDSPVEPPHSEEPESESMHEPADAGHSFVYTGDERSKPQRRWVGIATGVLAGLTAGVLVGPARFHSQPVAATAAPAVASRPLTPGSDAVSLRKLNNDLTKQVTELSRQTTALQKQNTELSKQQAAFTSQQAELSKQQGEDGKRQAELRQQRDDLAKQTAKLKADLSAQVARAQSLQQQLEDLRRQQQRRRLSIQSSDPLP